MIFKSPHPDVPIPAVPLHQYVLRHAQRLASKPALIDGPTGRTLSYGQLAGAVSAAAAGLAARGFHKGEVFGICCPNLPEYAIAFLGVSAAGGVVTMLHPLYTASELIVQLQDAKARFVLTVPPLLEKVREAAGKSGVEEVYVLGAGDGATPVTKLLAGGGTPPALTFDPKEDLVTLPYSAGTTGLPKGVMLTHRNLVANLCQCEGMRSFESYTEQDVGLAVLPFFHIFGMLASLLLALAQGATVVTMPRFDMEEFLSTVEKYRATVAPVVPPIMLGLERHPALDQHDLSSLRLILCGASPLSEGLAQAVSRRLGCKVAQGYGMTEASPVTHIGPSREKNFKAGAVGWVLPNTEVMVVEPETRRPLGVGEPGELWIRGPQIMKGYLNHPEATAEAITPEGWYRTGDLGYVDGDGYFFVLDRLKELIKYKGQQVAPAELEAVLLTHPAIADAAVIPSPDEEAGEVPKAFIVVQSGHQVSAEEVMGFVAARVAPHKRIRRVEFVGQVPKSLYGKILRRVLVEQERLSRASAVQAHSPG